MNCIGCGKSEYRFIINEYTRLCESCVSCMFDTKQRIEREDNKYLLAFIMIGLGFIAGGVLASI